MGKQLTNEEYIAKAFKNEKHNGIDYSNFNINIKDENGRCKFLCRIHGEFWQTPKDHLNGCTCPECSKISRRILKTKPFLEMVVEAKSIHGNDYEYFEFNKDGSKNYINAATPMNVWCNIHKELFPIRPANLINQKQGCPKCRSLKISKTKTKTQEQFEKDVYERWGDRYDLSKVVYRGNKKKVILICHEIDPITGKEHGEFKVRPNDLYNKLSIIYPDAIHIYHCEWLKRQELDIYIPSLNIGIEYQGVQHFKPNKHFGGKEEYIKTIERDKRKYDLCVSNGVNILYYTEEKFHPDPNSYLSYLYLDYNELLGKIKSYDRH